MEEDSVPDPPAIVVSIPGELWVLGRHRVLCGDALSGESLDRVMQGRTAAMVFSDFPYNVNYHQKNTKNAASPIANDNLGAHFEEFLQAACVQLLRVTEGAVYLCMSSSELHTLHRAFTATRAKRAPKKANRGRRAKSMNPVATNQPREGSKKAEVIALLRRAKGGELIRDSEAKSLLGNNLSR